MTIDVNDFEIDPEPKYCPVCEEFVILRKGKRSCKCTRVRGLDPKGTRCFDWIDREDMDLFTMENKPA